MYETTENTWRERDSVFTSSMTNRALSIPSIVFFFSIPHARSHSPFNESF